MFILYPFLKYFDSIATFNFSKVIPNFNHILTGVWKHHIEKSHTVNSLQRFHLQLNTIGIDFFYGFLQQSHFLLRFCDFSVEGKKIKLHLINFISLIIIKLQTINSYFIIFVYWILSILNIMIINLYILIFCIVFIKWNWWKINVKGFGF